MSPKYPQSLELFNFFGNDKTLVPYFTQSKLIFCRFITLIMKCSTQRMTEEMRYQTVNGTRIRNMCQPCGSNGMRGIVEHIFKNNNMKRNDYLN